MNFLENIETVRNIIEAGKDGMKVLRSWSDIKSLEKILDIQLNYEKKRVENMTKVIKDLNIENKEDVIKTANMFMTSMNLTRDLNGLQITVNALKNIREGDVSEGIDPNLLSTFIEKSKDIIDDNLKGTWENLLRIESKESGTVTLRLLNILENLSGEEIRIFNQMGAKITNDIIYHEKDSHYDMYNLSHDKLTLLQDAGLVQSTKTSFQIQSNFKGKFETRFDANNFLLIAIFDNPVNLIGFRLTKAGKAIRNVIDNNISQHEINLLVDYLKEKKVKAVAQYLPEVRSIFIDPNVKQ